MYYVLTKNKNITWVPFAAGCPNGPDVEMVWPVLTRFDLLRVLVEARELGAKPGKIKIIQTLNNIKWEEYNEYHNQLRRLKA